MTKHKYKGGNFYVMSKLWKKNEVNFRYTQVINGEKREIALCDKCAKKLGLESLDFSREIENLFNMSFAESFLPSFARTNMLGSRNLGTIFNNDIFSNPILWRSKPRA